MSTILDKIFEIKRHRVDAAKRSADIRQLVNGARRARKDVASHRFRYALEKRGEINVIAEFKRASPSKGVIKKAADPATVARAYESGGAAAISVLTEEDHFRGSLYDLQAVRQTASLPVLRKDFIFDEFQIYESAIAGADALLLIVAALGVDDIRRFLAIVEDELGMDALLEVHTEEEMSVAAEVGAVLIGVNNRNLKTFEVSLDVSHELARLAPRGATLVAESGLSTRRDIDQLRSVGYSGFLIGESLMRSTDIESAVCELVQGQAEVG